MALLLAAGLAVALRRGRGFAAALCGLSLLALPVQLVAVTNVREELHAHVVLWFAGIAVPALIGIGAALAPELRRTRVAEAGLAIAVGVVTAIGAVELAGNASIEWDPATGGDYAYEGWIEPLWRQLERYTEAHSIERPAVAIATKDRWLYAAGVVEQLQRRGDRVRVDPAWAFMFGDDLRADGGADATLVFAAPAPPPPLPRGARVAAATPEVTIYAAAP